MRFYRSIRHRNLASLVVAMLMLLAGCTNERSGQDGSLPSAKPQAAQPDAGATSMSNRQYTRPSNDELRRRLTPLQYKVTQEHGTEPPFNNAYWDNHEAGLYVDITTGQPLFSSVDKFDSGTGWPSFTRPVSADAVTTHTDKTLGYIRVEVRSSAGDAHLGHVFNDGPEPTGLRYCINSAALRFIPLARLEAENYGEFRAAMEKGGPGIADMQGSCAVPAAGDAPGCAATVETAILAGGCFWGMEDILARVPGVLDVDVGYCGGKTDSPTYKDVKKGTTGHAEAVRVVFDPQKLTYEDLLRNWFFRMHDPTTLNRQGNDIGSQYRSAIFYTTQEQRKTAEAVKASVDASGKWKKPIVTEIVEAGPYTKAEEYHQDYLMKNPGGYTCHFLRD